MEGVKTARVPHTISCLDLKPSNTKKSGHHFHESADASVVGVFNKVQGEAGKGTCFNGSASTWLREEQPKLAIHPHQADFCNTCARIITH